MSSELPADDEALWRKLFLSEEARRTYPLAMPWRGGYRWFQSDNVIDLQDYRSSIEKERICRVLLRISNHLQVVEVAAGSRQTE
jgi:hypothetical protein